MLVQTALILGSMGFLDQLRGGLKNLSTDVGTQVSKFKSNDFAEASMAMCALIAAADGTISSEEKGKMAGFISRIINSRLTCGSR